MLGKSDQRFDRIFANKFIGTIDKAKTLDIPSGGHTYVEGTTLENGLYLFHLQNGLTGGCKFQAVIRIDGSLTDEDVIYLGEMLSGARFQVKIKEGKVVMCRAEASSTSYTPLTGSDFWANYIKIG
jgi:hypothetical protein